MKKTLPCFLSVLFIKIEKTIQHDLVSSSARTGNIFARNMQEHGDMENSQLKERIKESQPSLFQHSSFIHALS